MRRCVRPEPRDFAAGCVGFEPRYFGVGEQSDVGMLQRGNDAADMRISFGIDQTRIAVAGAAANAGAVLPVSFIEHHSERRVKRVQTKARKIVAQLLNARLVTDRRIGKGAAACGSVGSSPTWPCT